MSIAFVRGSSWSSCQCRASARLSGRRCRSQRCDGKIPPPLGYPATVAGVESGRAIAFAPLLRVVSAAILLIAATGCGGSAPAGQETKAEVPVERPTVIAETPHDPAAFTEGFELDGTALYEGTGKVGESQLRELDPATGAVLRSAPLPPDFFGEGIAVVGDRIWQLTWKNGVAIEWDKASFTPLRQVPMSGEGWGLCYDGDRLIRSDGTNRLHFHDPTSFAETGSVTVTKEGAPFSKLNELACVDGQVWANQFMTDRIARIDPAAGKVTAIVDAAGLLDAPRRARTDVLNGIAYAGNDEFLVTGKYWPAMFRVRFDSA
jgi:glutamine cyclotransferase